MDRIVLIGAGRTSRFLVERLIRIAPTVVVDVNPAMIEEITASPPQAAASGTPIPGLPFPLDARVGDGTSRLVLEDLRGDPASKVACVIATATDRANLEVCRLAADLGFRPIIAVANDPDAAARLEALGARGICKPQLVAQVLEQALQSGGISIATTVGFGKGEIVEFRVLPSSPAIGVTLAYMRPDGWRVAAIYRGSKLVLPTGKTKLEADDRALVIGDPAILRHVAESIRVGLPMFPLPHGPNVVAYLPTGPDSKTEAEARVLTITTRAAALIRAFPDAKPAQSKIEIEAETSGSPEATPKALEDMPLVGATLSEHVACIQAKKPGVVVTRAAKRGLLDAILGRGGRDAALCDELSVPLLFPKGSGRYERVVFGVAGGSGDPSSAEVALDLARMFGLPFCVERVRLPRYLGFDDAHTEKLVETIEHRARLHAVPSEILKLEGNPIAEWARAARPTDLMIVSRRRGQRDSFTSPDLALRLARRAPCSVLICTAAP